MARVLLVLGIYVVDNAIRGFDLYVLTAPAQPTTAPQVVTIGVRNDLLTEVRRQQTTNHQLDLRPQHSPRSDQRLHAGTIEASALFSSVRHTSPRVTSAEHKNTSTSPVSDTPDFNQGVRVEVEKHLQFSIWAPLILACDSTMVVPANDTVVLHHFRNCCVQQETGVLLGQEQVPVDLRPYLITWTFRHWCRQQRRDQDMPRRQFNDGLHCCS